MKNLSLIAIIFLIAIIMIMAMHIKSQNQVISEKKQEVLATAKYIENLKTKLLESESSNSAVDNQDNLRNLLEDFLKDNESVDFDLDLYNSFKTVEKRERFIPNFVPVTEPYVISQRFSDAHKGIDFATELGREVYAAAAGEIVKIAYDKYFGNMVVIDHFNGYLTVYSHLAKSLTEMDEFVKKGDIIGLVGSTGNSTGSHLHFEILNRDVQINPEEILNF